MFKSGSILEEALSVVFSGVSAGDGRLGNGNAFANKRLPSSTAVLQCGKIPAYASGVVMGGPEAVMPLVRTSSGKLGVRSEGGYGLNQVINVVMNN